MSREDVEFLLKSQETKTKNLIAGSASQLETRLTDNMTSYTYDLIKVQNLTRKRHGNFETVINSSNASIQLMIKYLVYLVSKEVTKPEKFCVGIQQNIEVLLGVHEY